MTDPRVEKLAKILVQYSTEVQPGDWVIVRGSVHAMPLVHEVLRQVLQAGGRPTVMLESEDLKEIQLKEASEEQIQWITPIERLVYDQADVWIVLEAENNTRALTGVPPSKLRTFQQARHELQKTYMRRAAENSLRWVLTQYPTAAYAQDADMSLREFEDFVYAATFADQPDPIGAWKEIHNMQERLIEWLKGKSQVVVRGPNADLRLSIAGRTFINSDGHRNMPSGEIYTGPVETSVEGWVRFTYPAVYRGREVTGVELEFREGKVVNARAEKNEDYLLTLLDSDPGARYLGEFAIGTNYGIQRFTRRILYDEKIGGSFHMAIGAGYPETGSKNESSVHWDFICDMRQDSEILVDGELFYRNGQFQV